MSFAGVSVVSAGSMPQGSAMIYSGSSAASRDSWYHLLVVEGYSRFKDTPTGVLIKGCSFQAGGHRWAMKLYPNGCVPDDAGFVSVYLFLDQADVARHVMLHLQFSLIDEADKQEHARIRAIKPCAFSGTGPTRIWGRRRHVKDDCFTIRCDSITAEAADAPLIEVPSSNISEHLSHLLMTKVGADVMFEVGPETFVAHRCVLASHSPVFMAQLFGPMKEGTMAKRVQGLLSFVYTDLMPEMEAEGADVVTWLRHLLAAADRFDLQRLKSMCEERLSKHIDLSWVTATLGLAAQHHCHGLKEACLEFLKVQSPEDLRGVMATSDWEHIAATDHSVLNELIGKLASKV
ncbi:hypothetical protein VPH35_011344 [Triticum aestivum]